MNRHRMNRHFPLLREWSMITAMICWKRGVQDEWGTAS